MMVSEPKYAQVPNHVLEFYIPYDSEDSFILRSDQKPHEVPRSKVINIECNYRSDDKKWLLSFELLDKRFSERFSCFRSDVLKSTADLTDPKQGPDAVVSIFNQCRNLFLSGKDKINESLIQGTVGEMLFLREYLLKYYGEYESVKSWMNSYFGKQDFTVGNVWYEVKTIQCGVRIVKITSLEQLNGVGEGHLCIVELNKVSEVSSYSVNINTLYDSMYNSFIDIAARDLFAEILADYMLPNTDYDKFNFELLDTTMYTVGEGFPKMSRSNIPSGISDMTYSISINALDRYKE